MRLSSHLKQRILGGGLGTIGLAVCIYYSFTPIFRPVFIFLNGIVITLALLEYYRLTQSKGFQPLTGLAVCFSFAYIISLGCQGSGVLRSLPTFILLALLLASFLLLFNQKQGSIGNLAVTSFGIIYLTLPLSCAMRINYFFSEQVVDGGRLWLAYTLAVSKITDIGAYFFGKLFGKNKLAPWISPKKTVEGAVGGACLALLASLLFFPTPHAATRWGAPLIQSIGIGLLIALLAQLGDLAESLLKRDAGIKDSNRLPGLGGVLDVVDSLVFSLPLVYLLLEMRVIG